MKKDSKLSQALVLVLVFPIVILMALFLLLYTPVDFVRYVFSNRRKEMKRLYGNQTKYTWLVTLTNHYRIFELISKNRLPILFVRKGKNPCTHGYFYYNQTLFLADVVPHFNSESGNWYIVRGHDESDLSAYIEAEKEDFHKCVGFNENAKCERIVFLVKEKDIYDEARNMVENADFILTYSKKNFAEKINGYISAAKCNSNLRKITINFEGSK